MDEKLEQQLRASMQVHRPMEADCERSVETRCLKKKVLHSQPLWVGGELSLCILTAKAKQRQKTVF